MILFSLMLLAAQPRAVLLDDLVRVPPSRSRAIDVFLKQRGAVLECRYAVEHGRSGVRVALMSRADSDRFEAGRSHRPLISTPFRTTGAFRHPVAQPGEYRLVIDNRLEARGSAIVRVQLTAAFDDPLLQIRELPAGQRGRVVMISLGLFSATLMWAAWLIRRASIRNNAERH